MLVQCLCELVNEAPFLYTTELDNVASLCFRAMDSSNYDVRCDVAKLLGRLLAATQTPQAAQRCLLYTSPSPRDRQKSRMPSSA